MTGGVPYDSLTPMPEFRQYPTPLFGAADSLFRNTASPATNFASTVKQNSLTTSVPPARPLFGSNNKATPASGLTVPKIDIFGNTPSLPPEPDLLLEPKASKSAEPKVTKRGRRQIENFDQHCQTKINDLQRKIDDPRTSEKDKARFRN